MGALVIGSPANYLGSILGPLTFGNSHVHPVQRTTEQTAVINTYESRDLNANDRSSCC